MQKLNLETKKKYCYMDNMISELYTPEFSKYVSKRKLLTRACIYYFCVDYFRSNYYVNFYNVEKLFKENKHKKKVRHYIKSIIDYDIFTNLLFVTNVKRGYSEKKSISYY